MEPRAHYVSIGLFVLGLGAAMVVFTLWIGRVQLIETRPAYHIYFPGSVTGLKTGSPVRYHGIPVGKVTEIRIDPDNVERVRVTVRIDPEVPVKTDTVARLEVKGMTGNSFVQLTGSTAAAPPVRPAGDGAPAVIPSERSALDRLLEDAPAAVDRFLVLGERLNEILSVENERLITDTLANLHRMSRSLADTADDAEETMVAIRRTAGQVDTLFVTVERQVETVALSVDRTLARVRLTLAELDHNAKLGLGGMQETMVEVQALARALAALSDEASGAIAENRTAVRDFSGVGLYELSRLIVELRALAVSLSRVSREIERGPVQFLFSGTDGDGEGAQ